MTEQEYLDQTLTKLDTAIKAVEKELNLSDKDIFGLQEYYWENYTEFDEYGYEEFENRQQILTRVNSKSDYIRKLYAYSKMKDSPYFARVDFRFEDDDDTITCYIGICNFAENKGEAPIVYDWRAPISSLFYDYDKGPAKYTAPMGDVHGELIGKYQYSIKKGKLIYAIESDIKIDDDILRQALSLNADARLKSIVSTIQKEQNQIIRNEKDRVLIVQGGAGSGKTSIALHRIAYLLYHRREELNAKQVLILSPNDVFSDYISHILPELGEEKISEMTFDDFAKKELAGITRFETHYDFLEDVLSNDNTAKAVIRNERLAERGSAGFAEAINGYVLSLEYDVMNFRDFKFKKMEKSADEIADLFYNKLPDIPLFKRMEAVCEYVVDEYQTLMDKDLDELELEIVKEKFERMYETKDVLKLYSDFLESIGEEPINLEERYVGYEDAYAILYLKYLLNGAGRSRTVKHLIIDEMQDYSYMQYCIIGWTFKCPMTILGDVEQSVDSEKSSVLSFLPHILGKDSKRIVLNKSYRQTVEIAEYAAGIAGITGMEFFERHGRAPELHMCDNEAAMLDRLVANINSQLSLVDGACKYETTAILTKTQKEAAYIYDKLAELDSSHTYTLLNKYTDKFTTGIVIAPFYLAKGLEFDTVHVVNVDKNNYNNNHHRQILYICATRALFELDMYGYGEKSPII